MLYSIRQGCRRGRPRRGGPGAGRPAAAPGLLGLQEERRERRRDEHDRADHRGRQGQGGNKCHKPGFLGFSLTNAMVAERFMGGEICFMCLYIK